MSQSGDASATTRHGDHKGLRGKQNAGGTDGRTDGRTEEETGVIGKDKKDNHHTAVSKNKGKQARETGRERDKEKPGDGRGEHTCMIVA